jgi:hypothetical protein
MALYKNYIELTVLTSKLTEKIKLNPLKAEDIYRRTISTAINSLHQISQKKSIGGYALSIEESKCVLPDMDPIKIQSVIRIFTKKKSTLEHLRFVISSFRIFLDFFSISDLKIVPDNVSSYSAYIRVRMPTKKKQGDMVELKKSELEQSTDCNYIFLMPSSSIRGSKRLIRYYYRTVPMDCLKTAQYSKPDGYGFSRTNRLCVLANLS